MKNVALIHSVKVLANKFDHMLAEYLDEEVKIHNLWDDFLANNPNEVGEFTINNRNRLFHDIKSAEMTGADIIVVTCSTLTPIVDFIRPFIKTPLISIDDEMVKMAVKNSKKLLILATASSTKKPLEKKIKEEAQKINKEITIDFLAHEEAFHAMKALDMQKHDELLMQMAKEISGYDSIILAQASMAHLDKDIEAITQIPTYSSIALCLQQIKETLKNI